MPAIYQAALFQSKQHFSQNYCCKNISMMVNYVTKLRIIVKFAYPVHGQLLQVVPSAMHLCVEFLSTLFCNRHRDNLAQNSIKSSSHEIIN